MSKQSGGFWFRIARGFSSLRAGWNKLFIKRELFVRENRGTRRIVFEKSTQIQLTIVGLGLLLWVAYATSGIIMGKNSTRIMQERLAETHNAYEERIAAMQKKYEDLQLQIIITEKEFTRLTKEVTQRHQNLTTLIGIREKIGETMKKRQIFNNKIKNKRRSKKDRQSKLKPLHNHDSVFLTSRPAGPTFESFPAFTAQGNQPNTSSVDFERRTLHTGQEKIDRIIAHMTRLDREQRAILDHLEENIVRWVQIYQNAFATTEAVKADLFSERIIFTHKQQTRKVGGPLIAMTQQQAQKHKNSKQTTQKPLIKVVNLDSQHVEDQANKQMNAVHQQLQKLILLDKAIPHLPLEKPISSYHITSAFGPRIDPFTREWAFHTGLDIAGFKQDKVQITLPGRVVFAARARGYGMMVEVEHAYGFKTRYGHLKKIMVRLGQKVRFKQVIGIMGNSGRSTGKHLHYEVLLDEKPYDPWKFIEAGKYVFEAVQ